MEDTEPILQEIEDSKEKLISRISLWVSLILTTVVVIWYYNDNPPDSPAVVKMRVFCKENNRDVMTFIDLPRNEMIAFAYKKKHPFYLKYVNASESEKAKLKALIHISTDFTPNQYWFNLFFAWVIFFTTFWFIGLMVEACIILMRRNSESRIKKYKLEQEQMEREQEIKSPPK
ncbi:MAG: hypothetical protein VX429_03880 [Nitrospinota bacterium]|nr:hypothetical protein [Nitrospinota bacterium]